MNIKTTLDHYNMTLQLARSICEGDIELSEEYIDIIKGTPAEAIKLRNILTLQDVIIVFENYVIRDTEDELIAVLKAAQTRLDAIADTLEVYTYCDIYPIAVIKCLTALLRIFLNLAAEIKKFKDNLQKSFRV